MEPDSAAPDRRSVILGSLGLAAGVGGAVAIGAPTPAPASRHQVFQHGVASGDPLPHAVVLWTRVTPRPDAKPGSGIGDPVEVAWEISSTPDFRDPVTRGVFRTDAKRDFTVKFDADGLAPATTYWYRFTALRDSAIGRTRTAPAMDADLDRLRLGVVSCANWQAGYFSGYRHLLSHNLDAVVHLGDYLYEYQPGKYSHGYDWEDIRRHDPPKETITLADYRRRHAQYKTDPDLADLHAALPMIATWDDHEVADGWSPDGAFEHQPVSEGPWRERRRSALRAYDEWMPVRLGGTAKIGDGNRVYRRFGFGRLADISMLDLRGYRDERADAEDPVTNRTSRTLTGGAQERWLASSLHDTNARWKLVGNPVMMAPMLMPPRPRGQALAVKRTTDPMTWGTPKPNTDTWSGYPAQRRRLLEGIAEAGIDDVIFLSGDAHTAWANDIELDGKPLATELVCSAITSNNVDDFMGTKPRTLSLAIESAIQLINPHARFVNLDDHGFSIIELTPSRALMQWWAVQDRRDRRSGAHLLTSWQIASGEPRLKPV